MVLYSLVCIVYLVFTQEISAFQVSTITRKGPKKARTKTFIKNPSHIFNELQKNSNIKIDPSSYSDFVKGLQNKEFDGVSLYKNIENDAYGIISIDSMKEPKIVHQINIFPDMVQDITDKLISSHIQFDIYTIPRHFHLIDLLNSPVTVILFYVGLFTLVRNNQMKNGGNIQGIQGMTNSKDNNMIKAFDINVSFDDVAGCNEAKQELIEIVDFLKNPEKYNESGAKIPHGVLLEGVPGTGKTLMAKAVAGEANVPFFSVSGSEFIEIYVGVGAMRVRKLFESAKQNAPCVIFIDEIDAIGRSRGSKATSGNDEREQTLNQILTEMDGFKSSNGTIVLAATNRIDILDTALTRPGRFDRKVRVPLPDDTGRKQIFQVHTRNKKLDSSVDLEEVSFLTQGFSGADLENLANEAAILSVRYNLTRVDRTCIMDAYEKITIGLPNKNDTRSLSERKLVAIHEIGHALLVHKFKNFFDLRKVTIQSNQGGAGGYCLFTSKSEYKRCPTKEFLLANIVVLLGGRAAEIISFKDRDIEYENIWKELNKELTITTGASSDLKQAYRLTKDYVTQYGFGDTSVIIDESMYNNGEQLSDLSKKQIDKEITKVLKVCGKIAQKLLKEDVHKVYYLVDELLEHSTISSDVFE